MKHFSIVNWDEYQHGSGKTRNYPWIKLYGSLFRRHWFVEMSEQYRYWTICLLDFSRENNNKNPLILETFFRIYHLKFNRNESKKWFNLLITNGFVASKMLAECYQDASSNREEKRREEKKKIRDVFTPPVLDEVIKYFDENGYTKNSAIKCFNYYSVADWKDSKGNKVKNWKQKAQSVWFKDENLKPRRGVSF